MSLSQLCRRLKKIQLKNLRFELGSLELTHGVALIGLLFLSYRDPPLISFERTSCFGDCPAYRVTVSRKGTVKLWLKPHTNPSFEGKLEDQYLEALKKTFSIYDFMDFKDIYHCVDYTDDATVILIFEEGWSKKTLRHYLGCLSPPGLERLKALEAEIERILLMAEVPLPPTFTDKSTFHKGK